MLNAKKTVTLTIVFLLVLLAFASTIHFAKATTYNYYLQGPFWMNGSIAGSNTVVCHLLWANFTATTETLVSTGTGYTILSLTSNVLLYQMTWNASSAQNYTALIDFNGYVPNPYSGIEFINIYIPDPTLPSFQYTFSVTDFYGMKNAYLRMSINNATGTDSGINQEVSLDSAGVPTFVMTQYYTYTLTFVCDQGSYSQLFTAENTLANTLVVLAGSFPQANVTSPTATVERINATLIGIDYVDPSNSTSALSILITHLSGMDTINDYSNSIASNATTILWNAASSGISYNVNVSATISGVQYVWALIADESIGTNPFLGAFDWLGVNTQTLPHVQTGWPAGMTSAQIAEIAGACIVMLFLCIGSFRSAGACCMLSWIIFGILLYMGWMGVITPYTIPEFAFSGFIGILIMLDEAKQTARET